MKKDIFQLFDSIPCFTKQNLKLSFQGSDFSFNEKIRRALKNKRIFELKRGLYTTNIYYLKENDKLGFKEFIASKLRSPSYLSLEYVLTKYNILTEATYPVTAVTFKTTRTYQNFLGTYRYSSIKKELYFGIEECFFGLNKYFIANKSKALFDFFYFKRNLGNLKKEILENLRINWDNFLKSDFDLFKTYTLKSKSKKMKKILEIIEKNIYDRANS